MKPIRTLIVDDSAFVRKVVREMLSRTPTIEVVGVARDGEEALELTAKLEPDVVTCDLVMPRLDGVEFVRRQMALRPLPILILSAAPQDAGMVVEALAAGAIDFLRKPTALATDSLRAIDGELAERIHAAAGAPVSKLIATVAPTATPDRFLPRTLKADIVVIAVSTGGPQALRRWLPMLPADFPVPIAMVLHMPVGYTALFAEKLDELCQIEVCEAQDGCELRPGLAVLAQAGRHLLLRRQPTGKVVAELALHPLEKIHRPSADVLFHSAAQTYGARVLAVVMTGMGDDGREGCAWVKANGGLVLTEAEKSCIIYGMPRSVFEAGLSDAAVPLEEMAQAISERI